MDEPFVGSAAIARGSFSRHQLRTLSRSVLPDVYLSNQIPLSLDRRIAAAWLWAKRGATIAGLAAAAVHGAKWIDDNVSIELVYSNTHPPRGVVTRRDTLHDNEVAVVGGLLVTTPERTAYDIGRREQQRVAVARLDALARATGFELDDVAAIARRHRGARGLRRLEAVLELVDAGAQSPRETYLRLLLIRSGLPPPRTQIPVVTAEGTFYLDMGWEEHMVAVEYDGEQHRTDSLQYRKDIRRLEALQRMGWIVIRVAAGDHSDVVLQRVHGALNDRRSTVN